MSSSRAREWVDAAALALQWVGLALVFGFLLGLFQHGDRIALMEALAEEGQIAATAPAGQDLLERFGLRIEAAGGDPGKLSVATRALPGRLPEKVVVLEQGWGEPRMVATRDEAAWWALEDDAAWGWIGALMLAAGMGVQLRRRPAAAPSA